MFGFGKKAPLSEKKYTTPGRWSEAPPQIFSQTHILKQRADMGRTVIVDEDITGTTSRAVLASLRCRLLALLLLVKTRMTGYRNYQGPSHILFIFFF
jgi:hypothetical protein